MTLSKSEALYRAFLKRHRASPEIHAAFGKCMREAVRAGCTRMGARMVWERVRWEFHIRASSPFKLNDHDVPFHARLWQRENPNNAAILRTRRSYADEWI